MAINEIRKFYNRNDIDKESMNTAVKESLFDEHWEKTWYYKWFSTTSRNEDLLDAIVDLLVIAPKNKVTFMNFYKEFKDTPQKVATLIWTYEPQKQGEIRIYKLINMALIIDAKNTFGDGLKGNIKFATDFISQCNLNDVDHIIEHSIKFIRILNTALVDEGSKFNTCGRVAYRGVDKKVFLDTKIGERYRMITWCCSSDDKDTAEIFLKKSACGGSMIKFNIPKGCKNAGKINCFGKSWIPSEKETLIPPYTSIKMKKINEKTSLNYYEVYVAKDNQDNEFNRDEYYHDGKVIELSSLNTSESSSSEEESNF